MNGKLNVALLALAVLAAGGCSSETKHDRPEVKQPNSQAGTGAVQKAASSLQAWSKDGSELKTKLTAAYDDLSAAFRRSKIARPPRQP